MANTLFKTVSIVKEFSGVRVLDGVDLEVRAGEIFGVIGENGAGKSTLLKIIGGVYRPTLGELYLDGERIEVKNPITAKRLGISMVPQEFNLIGGLKVFENVFLGNELRRGCFLDKAGMRRRAGDLLEELGSSVSPDDVVDSLSVARKQMVEAAKALAFDSRLLILDEPTTVLTKDEISVLFSRMRALAQRGVAILFISHKLGEVREICDRVMVLRDGEQISVDDTADIDEHEMARRMVGRELTRIFPEKAAPGRDPALELRGLSVPGAVRGVDLTLRRGEVLGIAGLMGSGQTELAEAVMGVLPHSGDIAVFGKKADIRRPADAVALGIAYLSDDRQGKGIVLGFDIPSNITLISLKKYARLLLDKGREKKTADAYVKRFGIRAASLGLDLRRLSGGNQQKVYLSKWMDTEPKVLILNEPTRGIDVNAKSEIYHFIRTLAESGIACLIISSELEEIMGLCPRVLVMREGGIVGELSGEDVNEETIMLHAAGLAGGAQHGRNAAETRPVP